MKTLWEKENILVTSIFSFSHNVLYPFQNKFSIFSFTYDLLSANAFNLDQYKILLYGKELIHLYNPWYQASHSRIIDWLIDWL